MKNLKNKRKYWFDNKMAEGTWALIKLLTSATLIIIILIGAIIALVDSQVGYDLFKGFWLSLNHIIDPGQLGEDTGNAAYIITMILVTIIGLLITSTLIGIISNAIDEKLQELKRGKSVVVEKNHVIILGTGNGLNTMLSELIEANSNHKSEAVVVMDNKEPKDVMDEKIRQRFPDTKTTKIICRCGNIADYSEMEVCSFDTCRSVIINTDDDFLTIKTILAATNLLKKYNNTDAYIVAVMHNSQNIEAANIAGEGYAEILNFNDLMSRIIAHTSRNTGLSKVYTEIFDFDGSEIYIEEHPAMCGNKMKDLNLYFPVSIVIGIQRKAGDILLNPSPETVVEYGDKLILFAEDDGVSIPDEKAASFDVSRILTNFPTTTIKKKNMLIIGFSSKLRRILEEEDIFVAPNSQILLAVPEEQKNRLFEIENLKLTNIELSIKVCDVYNSDVLEQLIQNKKDVLVLADYTEDLDEEEQEKIDSKILLILLQLKSLSLSKQYQINVTSEMLKIENQELAQIAEVNDFIVSSNITSLMVTQICQLRELKGIFEELLTDDGSEIYIRPAKNYIRIDKPVNIYTAGMAAALHNEVLIGYRKYNEHKHEYEIVSNPPKNNLVEWSDNDSFIVVAVD